MSFDINKFKKDYQKMAQTNRELADRIARFEAEKADAIKVAVATAIRPLNERILEVVLERNERQAALEEQAATNAGLVADLDKLNVELANTRAALGHTTSQRNEVQQRLDAHDAVLAHERQKVTNLNELLGRVQDRMRRKERDEQEAILNRQAILGVAPGLNRR